MLQEFRQYSVSTKTQSGMLFHVWTYELDGKACLEQSRKLMVVLAVFLEGFKTNILLHMLLETATKISGCQLQQTCQKNSSSGEVAAAYMQSEGGKGCRPAKLIYVGGFEILLHSCLWHAQAGKSAKVYCL